MLNKEMESLSKAYQNALHDVEIATESDLERVITLLENQLELISCLHPRANTITSRLINYLKTSVYKSLNIASSLCNKKNYSPSFRNGQCYANNIRNRLLDTQISIYVILNSLNLSYEKLAELYENENRKTTLFSFIP